MNVPGTYTQAWESFWRDAPATSGAVFWDADASLTAALQLPLFEPYFDAGLPVVDFGCGNGTQTRYLAERYDRVVGVDLSEAAVGHARRADPHGVAEYQQLNGADAAATRRLHAEIGDANVYMRGVLHQCEPADRAPLVEGIAALLGERGRVFAVELAAAAKGVLLGIAQGPGGPPPKLGAVFAHGLTPGEVADEAVPGYFRAAGLELLAGGEQPLTTTEFRTDGTRIELPSNWLVAGGGR
ncbi:MULTISPECIES: class I SAM-dependent methyltransferase [unclassified Streptomyces]|uniref:class I SAM-dependent methyltransferase n=1 Tax=unclassified Streptomyces TaxID=2593676 RepID=UPI002034940D|nr:MULTISPECIES: class I SAM-dependent methyltransferase [unclassified Streptomyces]MCM2422442.1 class I SAM-dependent methyltransferase [Streptomyces sp. RKAG293]MCM2425362.1 class I SAM-dependent methyltransferase [Streptomyces sp. RKAG337]